MSPPTQWSVVSVPRGNPTTNQRPYALDQSEARKFAIWAHITTFVYNVNNYLRFNTSTNFCQRHYFSCLGTANFFVGGGGGGGWWSFVNSKLVLYAPSSIAVYFWDKPLPPKKTNKQTRIRFLLVLNSTEFVSTNKFMHEYDGYHIFSVIIEPSYSFII